jgi:glutamine synthetase
MDEENVQLFVNHKVLSKAELKARTEILLDAYSMTINIEAKTTLNIAQRQILPAAIEYSGKLAKAVESISNAGTDPGAQKKVLSKICELISELNSSIDELKKSDAVAIDIDNTAKKAENFRDYVVPAMSNVRKAADDLEMIVDAKLWPLPTYAEMLFIK